MDLWPTALPVRLWRRPLCVCVCVLLNSHILICFPYISTLVTLLLLERRSHRGVGSTMFPRPSGGDIKSWRYLSLWQLSSSNNRFRLDHTKVIVFGAKQRVYSLKRLIIVMVLSCHVPRDRLACFRTCFALKTDRMTVLPPKKRQRCVFH